MVLGPITGVLVGACVASLKARRPILAVGCVVALAAFWVGAPALLTAELSTLPAALNP
jgi:pheromone shutdown protein TraB